MAASLLGQGYQVTAINVSYEDCVMLAELKGLNVIHGDGTKPYILDEAGAAQCDIAIALSSRDTDNLVACQLCKKLFGISKTVSVLGIRTKPLSFIRWALTAWYAPSPASQASFSSRLLSMK